MRTWLEGPGGHPAFAARLLDALEASGVTPSLSNAWRQVVLLHGLTWPSRSPELHAP